MFCVHGYCKRGYVVDFFKQSCCCIFYCSFFAHVEYFIRKKVFNIFVEMTTEKPIIGGGFPNNQENPTKDLN